MRRVLCFIGALLICVSLVCPVLAATGTFVPSVPAKDHPDISGPELCDPEGNKIEDIPEECLIITSVQEAQNGIETGISDEDREILLDVYKQLEDGSMKLPYEEDADKMVIRDLLDASMYCSHSHNTELDKPGVCIKLTFDLGVSAGTDVIIMAYVDGEWITAESVVNNGNGTVTCILEDICPIAFSVKSGVYDTAPKTGDAVGQNLALWITVMAISLTALVVLIVVYFKKKK